MKNLKHLILVILVMMGFHGKAHCGSCLNVRSYRTKKALREARLMEWMHNNGLGS
jgi:hypothetical protein